MIQILHPYILDTSTNLAGTDLHSAEEHWAGKPNANPCWYNVDLVCCI